MAVEIIQIDLDCQKCNERLKQERGCNGKALVAWYINDVQYRQCPIKLITPLSWEYIRAYSLYKKDIMPNGSGWINESSKYLDAMVVIENELSRIEVEELKKRKK